MKKIKYNLEKNKKRIETMKPTFEPFIAIGAFCTSAVVLDLEKVFNVDLVYTKGILSSLFFYGLVYTIMWLIDSIVYLVIENKRKKQNKEVENENK